MAVLRTFGVKPISLREYQEEFDLPYMSFYKRYIPRITKKQQDKIFKSTYPKCPKSDIYPGLRPFLIKCRKSGKKLFIVASDHKVNIAGSLRRYKIKKLFTQIVYNAHQKQRYIAGLICQYGLEKNDTLFIGDTEYEINASRKLGIISAGTTWGLCTAIKMRKIRPDFIIQDIKDLEKVVFGI